MKMAKTKGRKLMEKIASRKEAWVKHESRETIQKKKEYKERQRKNVNGPSFIVFTAGRGKNWEIGLPELMECGAPST